MRTLILQPHPSPQAWFCLQYEAFSSLRGPDLGVWGNHMAGPAVSRAHSLGLRPACCSLELGPAEVGAC
jgi:hypothetical protein